MGYNVNISGGKLSIRINANSNVKKAYLPIIMIGDANTTLLKVNYNGTQTLANFHPIDKKGQIDVNNGDFSNYIGKTIDFIGEYIVYKNANVTLTTDFIEILENGNKVFGWPLDNLPMDNNAGNNKLPSLKMTFQ